MLEELVYDSDLHEGDGFTDSLPELDTTNAGVLGVGPKHESMDLREGEGDGF